MPEINGEILPPLESENKNNSKEQETITEPIKKETRGRKPKGFNSSDDEGLSYKKTGEYVLKFADKVKQSQKGEEIDNKLKKEWLNSLQAYLDSKNLKFLKTGPLTILLLTTAELLADIIDFEKLMQFIDEKTKQIKEKKKNEVQSTKK
jgi:hypothetical protein